MFAKSLALAAVAATAVSAHGFVDSLTVAGTKYPGYMINQDPYMNPVPDRVVRAVQGNGPVENVDSIDIQCGGYTAGGIIGSKPAKLHAGPVAAGSKVGLTWTIWPDSHVGPSITYMAKCPADDCSTWSPGTEAVWFKVAEMGRVGTSDVWGSSQFEVVPNLYEYTIPSCLAAGAYLVRHELLALHSAQSYPGAQFYPSCHQLKVTGSGTSTGPAGKVAFPGAYKGSDPGISYDAYKGTTYPIPGPALFTC